MKECSVQLITMKGHCPKETIMRNLGIGIAVLFVLLAALAIATGWLSNDVPHLDDAQAFAERGVKAMQIDTLKGDRGDRGLTGLKGDAGKDGKDGKASAKGDRGDPGVMGLNGLNCWDLDGDGVFDDNEDINGDGKPTALDCRGSKGERGFTGAKGDKGDRGSDGYDSYCCNVYGSCVSWCYLRPAPQPVVKKPVTPRVVVNRTVTTTVTGRAKVTVTAPVTVNYNR